MRSEISKVLRLVWLFVLCLSPILFLSASSSTFAYDFQQPVNDAYDGAGPLVAGYDQTAVLTSNENRNEPDGTQALFGQFSKFLAAETTAAGGGQTFEILDGVRRSTAANISRQTNSMASATYWIGARHSFLEFAALPEAGAPSHLFIPNASTQGPPTSSAVQVNLGNLL